MPKNSKKFIIIDANALLHRSFHALPPLATKKGQLINAVYGFTTVLLKVFKEFKPSYMAVAYDMPGKTFRHKKFKEYNVDGYLALQIHDQCVAVVKEADVPKAVEIFKDCMENSTKISIPLEADPQVADNLKDSH